MRATLAMCLIALSGIGCRISLDSHDYQDAAPASGRLCTPAPQTASCAAAVGHAELSYVQPKILEPKCAAFTPCHGSMQTQDDLDLSDAMKTLSMVGSASEMATDRIMVVPGDINKSFLSVMIGAIKPEEADPPLTGIPNGTSGNPVGTMPYQNPTMCCEKIDAVTAWIAAGAMNN